MALPGAPPVTEEGGHCVDPPAAPLGHGIISDGMPPVRRVKLTVAYDGTAYSGWQVQPNGTTIQAVMEGAFSRILQEPVRLRAASRTDAGVHAREQVVDFADSGVRDLETVVHGGNAILPPDIRVLSASAVPETFDARRHAAEKEYRY